MEEFVFSTQALILFLLVFLAWLIHKISYQYVGVHVPLGALSVFLVMVNEQTINVWFDYSFYLMTVLSVILLLFAGYKDYEGYVRR